MLPEDVGLNEEVNIAKDIGGGGEDEGVSAKLGREELEGVTFDRGVADPPEASGSC